MAQNRKKSDNGATDFVAQSEEETKESRQLPRHRGPRRRTVSSPITLLQEEEVKIEINTTSKKPFRKPSHSKNIASAIKTEDTTNTVAEQNDKIVTPVESNPSTKKRKFPTVKRNN